MSDETLSYIRIATVVLSITYAIWQHVQKRKLENFIANKAIALSKSISIALGASQGAKHNIQNNQVIHAASEIGRTEGLLNAALVDSADLYCNLKKTTITDIEELANNNDTIKTYQVIFKMFSDRRIGAIRKIGRFFSKLY